MAVKGEAVECCAAPAQDTIVSITRAAHNPPAARSKCDQ